MHFQKITLAGVGLLGGSLGLAVKQRGLAKRVYGFVRRTTSISECARLGVVDHATCDPLGALENADLVVLCIPLAQMREILQRMLPGLQRGAIVTDVGSVKQTVIADMAPHIPKGVHLIPAHPVAGTENSGPDSGFPELFVNRWCILTPPAGADPDGCTSSGTNAIMNTSE